MEVDNQKLITRFTRVHARSESSMNRWLEAVKEARWNSPTDVVGTFNTAECVKEIWIFNIGGGKFRLAARIKFAEQEIRIAAVMTHAEYEKDKWK